MNSFSSIDDLANYIRSRVLVALGRTFEIIDSDTITYSLNPANMTQANGAQEDGKSSRTPIHY